MKRFGAWPRLEIINDDDRLVEQVLARSPASGADRTNRTSFEETATPKVHSSWQSTVTRFLEFIAFEPSWVEAANRLFAEWADQDVAVDFHAFDKKHFYYAVHQAREHPNAELSSFALRVRKNDRVLAGLQGGYAWDGRTCPTSPTRSMNRIYGDERWAVLSLQSAVDTARYDLALRVHGFHPFVDSLGADGLWVAKGPEKRRGL